MINEVQKGVLNDTFKDETERSNVPCNKLKADLNPSMHFQNMSSNEDMDMEEVPNAETNPAGGKTPAQVAHENRLIRSQEDPSLCIFITFFEYF